MPSPNSAPEVCELVVASNKSQLSSAVGSVHVAAVWQSVSPAPVVKAMFEGQPEMTGKVLSVTVTVNEQVEVFDASSVKV